MYHSRPSLVLDVPLTLSLASVSRFYSIEQDGLGYVNFDRRCGLLCKCCCLIVVKEVSQESAFASRRREETTLSLQGSNCTLQCVGDFPRRGQRRMIGDRLVLNRYLTSKQEDGGLEDGTDY